MRASVVVGVVLWDLASRKRLTEEPLPLREGQVSSVAFSPPDGKTIAAGYEGGDRGGVVLWDPSSRKRLDEEPLPVHEGRVHSVAFSPDGKTLATGYYSMGGAGVVLWDLASRKRLTEGPLSVREGQVYSVAFSRDGKTLAAGCYGGGDRSGVVLWDLASRKRLAEDPLPVRGGQVWSVAFSPDGKTLAAGYQSGGGSGAVLWDVDLDSWQRLAGRVANRNFTWEEWRQYFPEEAYHRTFRELPWPSDLPETERKQAEQKEKVLPPSAEEVSARWADRSASFPSPTGHSRR